jgi:DNA-binding transcriptional MerR regulator
LKGRGISFIDDKKVKVKGSEVGFSLAKIEKVLELKGQLHKQKFETRRQQRNRMQSHDFGKTEQQEITGQEYSIEKQISILLADLTKVEYGVDEIPSELKKMRKKKYRRKSWTH